MSFSKRQIAMGVIALAGTAISACDSNDNRGAVTSSGQVLSLAQTADDFGEPVTLNNGAFIFTDTREDSAPIRLNR